MVEVKLEGLAGVLQTLQSLPPEIVAKRGGPVKLALKKGALLILAEQKVRLQQVTSGTNEQNGEQVETSTGFLMKNLIVSRGKPPTSGKGERYIVRVRRKRYPGRNGKGGASTLQTAQLLEYGSSKQPAEPWIRPAFEAKARQAISVIETDLIRRLDAVVKKLERQNRTRK